MTVDIRQLNDKVKAESVFVQTLMHETGKIMVGQKYLMDRLMVALLANGHVLLEGVPGLAKTTAIKTLSSAIQTKFQRIQFTPDMLPADLTGTLIYDQKSGTFQVKKGPLFANLILADEINRAPAKVQSALLEAMQERQVTIGADSLRLEDPFLVLATQNPIEQEGTYPLPEAQVDRFMLKIKISYPNKEEELQILQRMAFTKHTFHIHPVVTPEQILKARAVVDEIYVDEKVQRYIIDVVDATRHPVRYGLKELEGLIEYGASPRASINLALASKAFAFLQGRGYVTPQDVKAIGMDVLRHRVLLTYEAEAESKTPEDIVRRIYEQVIVP